METGLTILDREVWDKSRNDIGKASNIRYRLYTARQAAYDMNKLRGKAVVVPIKKSRRYCLSKCGVRILAGLLILREKVIKPILAGICKKSVGRPPKNMRPIDTKYYNIRNEMFNLLTELHLVAS